MENTSDEIVALLLQAKEINISKLEEDFLSKALTKRIQTAGFRSLEDYCTCLKSDATELDAFCDSILISFSEFYRNPLTFAALEQVLFPLIFERKRASKQKAVRIWSAACARGQEPYSIAMIFDDLMEANQTPLDCRIFATDISAVELSKASKGLYPLSTLQKVPYRKIQKYFTPKGENMLLAPVLRSYVNFSVFDLLSGQADSPPASVYGDFDLIVCSNILFYYKQEYRLRILEKISNNMAPDGYLITGEAEREIVKRFGYVEIIPNSAIFQKKSNTLKTNFHEIEQH